MNTMDELPRFPSSGNRRTLDAMWLERLERSGLDPHLAGPAAEIPPQLGKAVAQFNYGAFWDCHETLEDLWRETPYPLRFFYHAIIKLAVGFHHVGRHNRHGGQVKLRDGLRLLSPFAPTYMGLDVDPLLADASAWLARLEESPRVHWPSLDALRLPKIRMAAQTP